MQEIKRRYVIPGDKIIEGNYKPLMNVIKSGNYLVSTRVGIAEAGKDGVKVIPLSGRLLIDLLYLGMLILMHAFSLTCLHKMYLAEIFHQPKMIWVVN